MTRRGLAYLLSMLILAGSAAGGSAPGIPPVFEANAGQFDPEVRFVSRGQGYTLLLTDDGAVFRSRRSDVRMKFIGASRNARWIGLEPLPTQISYLTGDMPDHWATGVPAFGQAILREAYPGIDIIFSGVQGSLEYSFIVASGADPGAVQVEFEGDQGIDFDSSGSLRVRTADGYFRHLKPRTIQSRAGRLDQIVTRYVRTGEHRAAFQMDGYDRQRSLVIDPVVDYSTYLGGSGNDAITGMAADSSGNVYITGWTESTSFPVSGRTQGKAGGVDVFVAKLNAAGSAIVYVTYLGGRSEDYPMGMAVDSSGSAVVTGWTSSADFPTVAAAQSRQMGARNAFVARLNSAGTALLFSTYLGGNGSDNGNAVAVDAAGNVYVGGDTTSATFPTVRPVQPNLAGVKNAFVAKLTSNGAIVYSTYLGGSAVDSAAALAVDVGGNVYVAGGTWSRNFPLVTPFQSASGGGEDAFVAKLNAAGTAWLYSTYLGGSGGDSSYPEAATGIAVDSGGNAYVAGITSSSNFPLVNALRGTLSGASDAFLAKLNAAGAALVYSTYLGGSTSVDNATGVAVDSQGDAYVAGFTASPDFPTIGPLQAALAGQYDAYLAILNPSGSALLMSTYLGGSSTDAAYAVALDSLGDLYLAGETQSFDFLSVTALQAHKLSTLAGFVVKMPAWNNLNAVLTAPAAGATLSSSPVTFAWSAVSGANDYRIDVGTSPGSANIYSGYTQGARSASVSLSAFLTGQPIYVELYTQFPGTPIVPGTGSQYSFVTAAANFSVSASSGQTVVAGNAGAYTVGVTSLYGFSGAVTFSVTGLPTGAGASFSPSSVTGSGSTTMTISTTAATAVGTYPLTITAVSGSLTHQASTSLTVTGAPNFSVAAQSSETVAAGSSVGASVSTTAANGFSGAVTFSVSGVPSGASASFNPTTVTGSGSTTMTITTTAATAVGTYPLTITAVSGSLTHQASTSLTVSAAAGSFTPIRVNAGGPAYTDPQGNVWSADQNYTSGATYSTGASIANTTTPALYQTERYNGGNLTYQFTVPNGSYTVTLKFAEIFFTSAGQRAFNVLLNGTTVKAGLDIFAAAGGIDRAYDVSYPVTVSGGQLTLTLTPVADNPKISAIQIVQTSATPDFSVTAQSSETVAAGSSVGASVSTTAANGFSGAVTFSVSGLPSGASASFSPTTVTGSGSTTMTISTTAATAVGTYPLTITAVSGSLTHQASTSLTVSAAAGSFAPIRVNAGGPAYTDPQGNVWSADQNYTSGATYSTGASIANTTTPALYQTERYNGGNLTYQFTVPNGSYTVTLKFAEIFFTSAGQRAFNVLLNGTTVKASLDIFAAAGGIDRAYDVSYPVTVNGGQLTLTLTAVTDNPKISAIQIVQTSATPDFSVTAQSSETVAAGSNVGASVSTTAANGFSGAVTFSVSGLPSGASASFSPTTVTGSGSTTMTISTTAATAAGTYPLTITAVSGSLTHQASTSLTVSAVAGSFTPIRVNAGGPAYTDPQGNVWSADQNYTGGATYSTGASIANTTTPALYQTERYNGGNLTYQFTVPNGSHTVTLKFAEIYFTSAGQRAFNVLLNGTTVKASLDIFAAAGGIDRAYDVSYPVTVSGGQLTLTLTPVADNPKISAIQIQ